MRLLLVAAGILACAFAPVPPQRTGTAEAVLNAFGGGRDQVRSTLEAMLPAAVQSEKVRGLACLKGEKVPSEWVRTRLRVEAVAPGGPVRVRLEGGRPNETLALLTALVETYEAAGPRYRNAEVERLLVMRIAQARAARAGGVVLALDDGLLVRRRGGPAVLQRPRLISSGKAR
jgi:hypothetical protein